MWKVFVFMRPEQLRLNWHGTFGKYSICHERTIRMIFFYFFDDMPQISYSSHILIILTICSRRRPNQPVWTSLMLWLRDKEQKTHTHIHTNKSHPIQMKKNISMKMGNGRHFNVEYRGYFCYIYALLHYHLSLDMDGYGFLWCLTTVTDSALVG